MKNHSHYNKNLRPFANHPRKNMTKAEACIWKYVLRSRGMEGYQFRRQRPVLQYIADFMCRELNLIIEIDGITHTWEETVLKDLRKDEDLKHAGFTVMRFTDEEVLKSLDMVAERIENWITTFEQMKQQSHPLVPASGG